MIFVIRTRGNPLRSRPSRRLAADVRAASWSTGCSSRSRHSARRWVRAAAGVLFAVLAATVVVYLGAVEVVKTLVLPAREAGVRIAAVAQPLR